MMKLSKSPLFSYREVVASLRDEQINARIAELRAADELTLALRNLLDMGMDVNDLSEASGLTVEDIRARTERELHVLEDVAALTGDPR